MPGRDRSGPYGSGPFGKRMGPCGSGWPAGRGFAGRRGYGFAGRGGWMMARELTPEEEKSWLEEQKGWLESQLKPIEKRLQELQEQPETKEE